MHPGPHRLRVTTRLPPNLTGILLSTDLIQRPKAFPRARMLCIQPQDSYHLGVLAPAVILNGQPRSLTTLELGSKIGEWFTVKNSSSQSGCGLGWFHSRSLKWTDIASVIDIQ